MVNPRKKYTSVGINHITRNKLVALTNIYSVTQKDLLTKLKDINFRTMSPVALLKVTSSSVGL